MVYRKSLLYLVSQAFEEEIEPPAKLLGMQLFSQALEKLGAKRLNFHYSDGTPASGRSASASHGGFDNDPVTMNDVTRNILGKQQVPHPFTKESLQY
jgi:hypothetical protein